MSKTTHSAQDDPRNSEIKIWINGELKPKAEAVVSVYDSGFLLGDGIWEGMRLYDGVWAYFDEHMDRLFAGCRAVSLDIGLTRLEIFEALQLVTQSNGMTTDAHCRLMVTRGVKVRPFQHPALSQSGPTVVILVEHSVPSEQPGIRLATVPQVRGLPMSQDPKLNSHSKLNCVIACLQAQERGADEALMLDPHGFVNTTNACNFFCVRKGVLWTSTGDYCMNGVTRAKVIELARADGIEVQERNFSLVDVYVAEEAFLTGTFGAQVPVAEIDGRAIGELGGKGPVFERIRELYKAAIAREVAGG